MTDNVHLHHFVYQTVLCVQKQIVPYSNWVLPIAVSKQHRIVVAIREHVAAEEALAGGGEAVGVDEAADRRVVITALQIIEATILGMVVAKEAKSACFPQAQPKERLWLGFCYSAIRFTVKRIASIAGELCCGKVLAGRAERLSRVVQSRRNEPKSLGRYQPKVVEKES